MNNRSNAKGCSPLPNRAAPETGCVDEMTGREQHANQVIPAFAPVATPLTFLAGTYVDL